MKKNLIFTIILLLSIVDIYSKNLDLFTSLVKQKEYSRSLEQVDFASDCLRPLVYQEISFQDYSDLMDHAFSVNHQYRDSLFINAINYLSSLGLKVSQSGKYDEAISIYDLSLSFISIYPIIDTPIVAGIHNQLGINYYNKGDYTNAIRHASDCYELYKHSSDTVLITSSLNNLGLYNFYANNYIDAKEYLDKACIYSLSLPSNHSEIIRALSNRALVLSIMGLYEQALGSLQECLHYLEKNNPMHVPVVLNNLCQVCVSLGKYDLAIEYGERALSLLKDEPRIDSIENNNGISLLLNNLSLAYYDLNNSKKAIEYLEQSLDLYKPINMDEYATLLGNLGMFYSNLDFQKSLDYYKQALDIISKENFNYPRLLNSVSLLLCKNEKYDLAKDYCELGIEAVEKLDSYSNPSVLATLYTTLSEIYSQYGKEKKSLEFCEKALELVKSRDVNDDLYALFKSNMAFKYSFIKGKELYAYEQLNEVLQTYTDLVKNNFDYLTEEERDKYWQKSIGLRRFIPLFVHKNYKKHPSFSSLAYNDALLTKGTLLQSSNYVRNSIKNSGDVKLNEKWDKLVDLHQMLGSPAINVDTKDSLLKIATEIERQIMNESREYRESSEIWDIDWSMIQENLGDKDVAIEFVDFHTIEKKDKPEHLYAALLVKKGIKNPIYLSLYSEEDFLTLLGNPDDVYNESENKVYNMVWSKILPHIKDAETIYFSPSGLLHQVAIEYLPINSNQKMSDKYNMVRLSSTREIVKRKDTNEYKTATIYGGIQYDVDTNALADESRYYNHEGLSVSRGIENDTLNRGTVSYLPGTLVEANYINTLLQENNISAHMYSTSKANEESFKSLGGKDNSILHIATHGFTWTDSIAKKQDYFTQRSVMFALNDDKHRAPIIDPLNRCGLLFAGANTALQGNSKELPDGVQDGILTAKEISLLDLSETNLVVLSACETAKGDISSEGVFGLQRAFKMAGVQTIIMSLWKVNDKATQMLMTEFYNNWIGKGKSKREAFRDAQNSVKKEYEEPECWAGFIMLD